MKRPTPLLVAALALAAAAPLAHAGWKVAFPVVVNHTSRVASGSLGTARNSADNQQHIGCLVARWTTYAQVTCEARNSAGSFASCMSEDPNLIEAAANVKGDSYVYFRWTAAGLCDYIYVANYSHLEPKQP